MDSVFRDEKILKAIADKLSGDISAEDNSVLMEWCRADKQNQKIFDDAKTIWSKSSSDDFMFYDKDIAWSKVELGNENSSLKFKVKKLRNRMIVFAASLIVFISASAAITVSLMNDFSHTELELITQRGERVTSVLPDGSRIKLNVATTMKFSSDLKKRNIELDGEAYFEVKKASQQMHINVNKLNIVVKGTAFNIKSFKYDSIVTVALKEGSILISSEDSDTQYKMSPGTVSYYNKRSGELTFKRREFENIAHWLNNKIYFNRTKLDLIAKYLEDNFDVNIQFKGKTLHNNTYTGYFSNETISEIIDAICSVSKLKYYKEGKYYYIRE